jgi:hypothetical protein
MGFAVEVVFVLRLALLVLGRPKYLRAMHDGAVHKKAGLEEV